MGRHEGSFGERHPTLVSTGLLLLFVLFLRLPVYALEAVYDATFSARRFVPLTPWWDLVTLGWSAVALGCAAMARWSSRNLRCPQCRGAMEVHEPMSARVRQTLALFGFDDTPHQACGACDLKTPLRSPRSPGLWWFAAVACVGVLVAVYAQRTHAVARFVHWFVG